MKKTFNTLILTSLLIGTLSFAPRAMANCQEIYGGSQNCATTNTFSVQKLVEDPDKPGYFVNNLSKNDGKYAPNDFVTFEIKVTNTSSQTINNLTVTDVFPKYLNFASGSGTFNTNTKKLSFVVKNLAKGQSATYKVTGKVDASVNLPTDQSVSCLVNQVNVSDTNGAINSSSSQFCVEKKVLGSKFPSFTKGGLTTTPATGPEMLPLFGLFPTGLAGFFLRKKTSKLSK